MRTKKISRVITRRKTGGVLYFNADTQSAIEQYQKTDDLNERENICRERILPAFEKLAENLIMIHDFSRSCEESYVQLKHECVAFLVETIFKYDPTRGTKAFSYFNVVAKNWLIIRSQQTSKRNKRQISIDDRDALSMQHKKMIENHSVVPSSDDVMIENERRDQIVKLLFSIKQLLKNEHEIVCMNAIINIFNSHDEMELLNKRAILVYIRDMSNLSGKQLTAAMSQIRKHYKVLSRSDEFELF
jgi:hypothetical protein